MEKEQFLSLVKNYTCLTSEEATELELLQSDYPYSQVVHNMAARAAQDNQLNAREHLLHVSAIYTTDRSVLKAIMTAERHERKAVVVTPKQNPPVTIDKISPTAEVESAKIETTPARREQTQQVPVLSVAEESDLEDLTGDALVADIMEAIKKLNVSRHKFETLVDKLEQNKLDGPKAHKKISKKEVDESDTLIEEIKTTKKKVAPEGKQKEQIEIIENFIKTKPSIAKNKKAAPVPESDNADDLAEKSLTYGDNIVSETLVEILLKQGKKDKAVEVLRKLIWKFPQKKTYFAARIDELKN